LAFLGVRNRRASVLFKFLTCLVPLKPTLFLFSRRSFLAPSRRSSPFSARLGRQVFFNPPFHPFFSIQVCFRRRFSGLIPSGSFTFSVLVGFLHPLLFFLASADGGPRARLTRRLPSPLAVSASRRFVSSGFRLRCRPCSCTSSTTIFFPSRCMLPRAPPAGDLLHVYEARLPFLFF